LAPTRFKDCAVHKLYEADRPKSAPGQPETSAALSEGLVFLLEADVQAISQKYQNQTIAIAQQDSDPSDLLLISPA
jgi:hypothetical protein